MKKDYTDLSKLYSCIQSGDLGMRTLACNVLVTLPTDVVVDFFIKYGIMYTASRYDIYGDRERVPIISIPYEKVYSEMGFVHMSSVIAESGDFEISFWHICVLYLRKDIARRRSIPTTRQ